jgi:hypothetical protein
MRSGLARKIPGGVESPGPLEEDDVNTYVILRRSGLRSAEELQEAVGRSIREHASRAVLPVDEIIPVADTVLVRPDPEPAQV